MLPYDHAVLRDCLVLPEMRCFSCYGEPQFNLTATIFLAGEAYWFLNHSFLALVNCCQLGSSEEVGMTFLVIVWSQLRVVLKSEKIGRAHV